ncbi:hypothetical protein F0562_031102 [Nyssa sinensis]|uniref:Neprosin domain-containing protein n=1 Tax=Nyssa sinensis TaxID=561372 RepID=A0A5J5AT61_9ASTE|nr:hypothetical protein F0562_031102 [Nyssa sinensis]
MDSSHPERKSPLVLSLALSLLLLPLAAAGNHPVLTYHKGPLLSGGINLSLLFYGQIGRVQKVALRNFIKSLNTDSPNLEPEVSSWWRIIESYQAPGNRNSARRNPKIQVRVASQVVDRSYSIGKVLIADFLPNLVQKATAGKPNTVAVIFAAKDVTVQDACTGNCYLHGVLDSPTLWLGTQKMNAQECVHGQFHRSEYGPQGITLQPPNGNVGTDAMVMHFAAALAATVTNPYKTGFFGGLPAKPIEAATVCPGMFGTGAFPGYTGKVRVDPRTGGGFNAHGFRGTKFLLPALWNPKTSSCWTTM